MKISKYNFFYPFEKDKEKSLAYNARTGALALIERENYKILNDFIHYGKNIEDERLLQNLKKGGFIVEDNINELDLIKYNNLNAKYSSRHLMLTIATTLNCNLDCVYCYEKDSRRNSNMSIEVQNSIVNLIEKDIKNISKFSVTWYGGEPLLALDVIENLSKKFIEICEKHNVYYSAGIVTNGYNLNKDTAIKLKNLKVNFAQVTLDGPKDIHDMRRPLVGGQGSFDVILKNALECSGIIDNVNIRINTDKENIDRTEELLGYLDEYGLKGKVGVGLGWVEVANDCYKNEKCVDKNKFSNNLYIFNKKLMDIGFRNNLKSEYPRVKFHFCNADAKNSYIIGPDGYLYKCWMDIGIKKFSFGNLVDARFEGNVGRFMDYLMYDPTNDEQCTKCSYLPICMGGCPRARLDKNRDRCSTYKYMLDDYLKEYAASLYIERQNIITKNEADI